MKWRYPLFASGIALVAVGVWAWKSGPEPETEVPVPASAPTPPKTRPAAEAEPAPGMGQIAGRVIRRGVGVAGAQVLARDDSGSFSGTSDAAGAFRLPGVPPGRYWISAALGDEASPLAGPVVLGFAERREGVLLELLAAGTVKGTVYDAVTRNTVAGAVVRSTGGSAVTNAQGRFTLRGLPVGATWLEAAAKGYLQRTEWLTLDAARELGGMEMFLQPASVLSGRVTRQGQPAPGAFVWAEVAGLGVGRTPSYGPVTAGADGRYALPTGGGALRLAASSAGGARMEGPTLTLAQGESRDGVDVELGEGLEAAGVVRAGGAPVEGATLWLLDGKTQRPAASTATQAGGRFVVSGLPVGTYLVQVQRGGLSAQRGPFALDGTGAEWMVDVELGRALVGSVEPAKAGVSVQWRSSDWAGPVAAETVTGPDGRFRFEGVPGGSLWVEAQDESGSARQQATAGTEVHLKLVPARVRGVVLDDAQHAVTDFTVRLLPLGGGPLRSYPVLSPTGDFQIEAPPGSYEVSAWAPAYGETGERPRIELQSGETFVKLSLQGGLEVSGRVVDAQSHAPLAAAEVVLFRSSFGGGRWATLSTEGDGTFSSPSAPKSGFARIRKDGYQPQFLPLSRLARAADGKPVEVALASGSDQSGLGKPYEGVGLQLDFNNGVRVASVFEGGPAQSAGVMQGDVILDVDGTPLAGLSPQDIVQRIMGASGTVVRLSLQRGDQTLDVGIRRQSIQF